jgi:hypothetical protein
MLDLEPVEYLILFIPLALVVLLGAGLYWLIRKAVRDGHQDAQP